MLRLKRAVCLSIIITSLVPRRLTRAVDPVTLSRRRSTLATTSSASTSRAMMELHTLAEVERPGPEIRARLSPFGLVRPHLHIRPDLRQHVGHKVACDILFPGLDLRGIEGV